MSRLFHKILTLILFVIILTQCSDKSSGEYVQEGLKYLNKEEYDSARESFLKAIEIDANNPDGYYGLGGIYNYQKKFKKAELGIKKKTKIENGKIEVVDKYSINDKVLIDDMSIKLINGSKIDYITELIGSSFKITNPQASSSCGCGTSFSV